MRITRQQLRRLIKESFQSVGLASLDVENYPNYDKSMMKVVREVYSFIDSGNLDLDGTSLIFSEKGFNLPQDHFLNSEEARVRYSFDGLRKRKSKALKKSKRNIMKGRKTQEEAKEEFLFSRQFRMLLPNDYNTSDFHYINSFKADGFFNGQDSNYFTDDVEEIILDSFNHLSSGFETVSPALLIDESGLLETYGPGYFFNLAPKSILKLDPVVLNAIGDEEAWQILKDGSYETHPLVSKQIRKFYENDRIAVFAWFATKMINHPILKDRLNFNDANYT